MTVINKKLDKKVYSKLLKRIDDRPKDRSELIRLARSCAKSDELDIESRIASAVIYIYKRLEDDIDPDIDLDFFLRESRTLKRKGGVRQDSIQLRLSILTAAWHIAVYQGNIDRLIEFLEETNAIMLGLVAGNNDGAGRNIPSYSKNIGCGAALLTYLHYLMGDAERAMKVSGSLVEYHIMNIQGVGPEMDPSVFNDTLNCGRCAYLSLCVVRACQRKMKMSVKRQLTHGNFAKTCSRIGKERFRDRFTRALESVEAEIAKR